MHKYTHNYGPTKGAAFPPRPEDRGLHAAVSVKTLTIKVPEELAAKLEIVAMRRGRSKAALVRAAIEDIVKAEETEASLSCLELARDLKGCVAGPEDLSYSEKYFREYGRKGKKRRHA